jgi:hypothetical protein
MWHKRLPISQQPGSRNRKNKGQGTECIFPGHTPSDLFPPTRPHLPMVPSSYESIKGLIHWLDQIPQNPIINSGTGAICDQKTSKFFVPYGKIHGRTLGCKGSLLKVRKEKKGSIVGTGAVCQQRVCFCFPGAFQTYANPGERQNQVIPIQ